MPKTRNKQVLRRKRISRQTLVIGADVGKDFNSLVLMDHRGQILKMLPKVHNNYSGYEWMIQHIRAAQRSKGLKNVIMALEPTGHYWHKLCHKAQSEDIKVVFVKTTAVKLQRGLDQSSRAKSDVKDAVVIANLVREGKYCDTVIKEDIYQELRRIVKHREQVIWNFSGAQSRLACWLDDYFPELRRLFSNTKGKGLRALLRTYPTPVEVSKVSFEDLMAVLAPASRRRKQAQVKVQRIQQEAAQSIGLTTVKESDRIRLRLILDDLDHLEKQIKVLEKEIAKLLDETEFGTYLLSVKGIGVITAAIFLGEIGDPRNFGRAKELISYSGLDPFETESGQIFGRRKLSKQGRFLLRATLYRMAVSVVKHNCQLRKYYKQKVKGNRQDRALNKKEALCAVAIKLVKLLFALMRDKRRYQKRAPAYRGARKVA